MRECTTPPTDKYVRLSKDVHERMGTGVMGPEVDRYDQVDTKGVSSPGWPSYKLHSVVQNCLINVPIQSYATTSGNCTIVDQHTSLIAFIIYAALAAPTGFLHPPGLGTVDISRTTCDLCWIQTQYLYSYQIPFPYQWISN